MIILLFPSQNEILSSSVVNRKYCYRCTLLQHLSYLWLICINLYRNIYYVYAASYVDVTVAAATVATNVAHLQFLCVIRNVMSCTSKRHYKCQICLICQWKCQLGVLIFVNGSIKSSQTCMLLFLLLTYTLCLVIVIQKFAVGDFC